MENKKERAIREALKFYKEQIDELKLSGNDRFMIMNFARKSIEIYEQLTQENKAHTSPQIKDNKISNTKPLRKNKIIIRKCGYCGKTGKHEVLKNKLFRHINCKFKSPI